MALCSVEGCSSESDRKGLCTRHYMRARRNGDPTKGRTPPGERASFVDDALKHDGDDCVIWPFFVNKKTGYAQSKLEGRFRLVHRFVCEKAHGSAPTSGHQAAHRCGKRACINPRHLSWKTPLENEADKDRHGTKRWGSELHNAKLTADEVTAIKVLRGRIPARQIAEIFGVDKGHVSAIQLGKVRVRG